jgi:hypothetical protein
MLAGDRHRPPRGAARGGSVALMSDDGPFERGAKLWVHGADGVARPAVYVGGGDNATFFGGAPLAYVVFEDTREPAEVEIEQITPRD